MFRTELIEQTVSIKTVVYTIVFFKEDSQTCVTITKEFHLSA